MALFNQLEILADDPILGLGEIYAQDPRSHKMDLGVGIYKDPAGGTPVMAAVKLAEQWLLENEVTKAYTGTAGVEGFDAAIAPLLLGDTLRLNQRHSIIQTLGGTGSLRLMAEFLGRTGKVSKVLIGVPTWPIHAAIFQRGGLAISTYEHLDSNGEFNLNALLSAIECLNEGDGVLLHACCHNPTGIDPEPAQWQAILEAVERKRLLPLFDMAYQGFGDGLEQDAWALRLFCEALPEVLAAVSCSKNFGVYRERAGALLISCDEPRSLAAVRSQVIDSARCLWSMPPSHGAAVVTRILSDATLRGLWVSELDTMRERIVSLRTGLCTALQQIDAYATFRTLARQKGMFSNLGRTPKFVLDMREQSGIYMVGQGRINVSGLQPQSQLVLAKALKAGLMS
ncbi:amino acid aminotransferase [Pseudomonas capsici]|uniref:amino acid aminotransferase n=1 Tax=Pseudomonas capsici TaxID=2810614 RepID=UPI000E3E44AF|nr:amino acid aminotransferase [Pseudomonas capsici]MCV4285527.1 aspartate/tyrosine/aromatic aminotransferase [Pseudomonas capsici]